MAADSDSSEDAGEVKSDDLPCLLGSSGLGIAMGATPAAEVCLEEANGEEPSDFLAALPVTWRPASAKALLARLRFVVLRFALSAIEDLARCRPVVELLETREDLPLAGGEAPVFSPSPFGEGSPTGILSFEIQNVWKG